MRHVLQLVATVLLSMTLLTTWAGRAVAAAAAAPQDSQGVAQPGAPDASIPEAPPDSSPGDWSFTASLYGYILPDDDSFLSAIAYADRDRLHLEARYNYEAMDTASLWGGWRFAVGTTVTFEAVPMLGFLFGDASAMAPGLEFSLGWNRFLLYSESEYVIDFEDSEASYFFVWSELTFAPLDWLAFGLVGQRTRAYETDVDVQRGVLVSLSRGPASLRGYLFNLDRDESFGVVAAGWEF